MAIKYAIFLSKEKYPIVQTENNGFVEYMCKIFVKEYVLTSSPQFITLWFIRKYLHQIISVYDRE